MTCRDGSGSVPADRRNHPFQVPAEVHPVQERTIPQEYQAVLQAALAHQQQQFQQQFQELTQRYQQQLQERTNVPSSIAYSEREVRLPEPFDGSRTTIRGFINQIDMVIRRKPRTYSTDEAKVMLVGSLLKDNALLWFSPLFERQDMVMENYDVFIQLMRARFDDPNKQVTAARRLESLRQGRRPVATYANDFQLLVCDACWDDVAARHQFRKGLNDDVKDLLLTCAVSSNLDDLILMAIKCGDRLFEREQERRGRDRFSTHARPNMSPERTHGDSMIIDAVRSTLRQPLDTDERARRVQHNLCMYCGEADHHVQHCSLLARRNDRIVGKHSAPTARTNQPGNTIGVLHTSNYPPSGSCDRHWTRNRHSNISRPPIVASTRINNAPKDSLIPLATVSWQGSKTIQAPCLIDSGASSAFVDGRFAKQHKIPLLPLSHPLLVEAIDGRRLPAITQQTVPLHLNISGIESCTSLYVIERAHHAIIIGMTWLSELNPIIDWRSGAMTKPGTLPADDPPQTNNAADSMRQSFLDPTFDAYENIDTLLVSSKENSLRPQQEVVLPRKYDEFTDVFEKKKADRLPEHRPYDCAINFKDDIGALPYKKVYKLSLTEQDVLRQYIDDNLRRGFIRHSKSPLGSPVLFVKKKDHTLRLCVDYRAVNHITKKEPYPIPAIDTILHQLSSARVFTKIDLRGAYNLLRIKEGDEWKTAWSCKYGHFEYSVMPFGLMNAPSYFQRLMNDVLREYLDDILVYSTTQAQHDRNVRLVLAKLRSAGLFAKLEKCVFDVDEVEFLGYVVAADGIKMDPSKVDTILQWARPSTAKDVQSFLGFANFYREFIVDFAKISAPLTALTKKDCAFVWSPAAESAFVTLKRLFTSAPIIKHFDPSRPIVVEADASDFALGCILSQAQPDGKLHPISFYSRKLSAPELNYEIHDKELLAIVAAFQTWRHFLEGAQHKITVYSDHKNLVYFTSAKTLNRRQARWSLLLAEYDFDIVHRAGSLSGKSDALSRRAEYEIRPLDAVWQLQRTSILRPDQLTTAPARLFAAKAMSHASLADRVRRNQRSDVFTQETITKLPCADFKLHNDVLYRGRCLVVAGEDCKLDILQARHDAPASGHFGIAKTISLVKRDYWWPAMINYVKRYVKSCDTCCRSKTSRHKPHGLLCPLPIADDIWRSITMDFIVKLPKSRGYDSILVVVDRCSKMSHFIPCRESLTAADLADLLFHNVFKLHGLPDEIISDRGPQFVSKFWKQLLGRLNIDRKLASSRHPETDGQTERVNQILEQYLRCYITFQQDNWFNLLPMAEFAYNNAEHASTKMTPFYAVYGSHPRFDDVNTLSVSVNPSADERINHIRDIRMFLKAELQRAIRDMKHHADKHRLPHPAYAVGDKVWLSGTGISSDRPSPKLGSRRLGPYSITEIINAVTYRLSLPPTSKLHNAFHTALLEPYVANDIPNRVQPPPAPLILEADNPEPLYIVNDVLDSRWYRNQLQYLLDWENYPPSERTWEPARTLGATPALKTTISEFHAKYPHKPGPALRRG